ncbi:MAG: hypothetical protein ABSD29_08310 [Verrucomicrobiota bacterium]
MKLIQATRSRLVFHLGQRENRLLRQVLKLYPRVPSAHQKLSKSSRLPDAEANQRLLDEALAERRAENKKHLQALLADPRRFAHTETGGRLSLSPAEVEWVLQVLNDIRVGSWIILGSPDEKRPELNERMAPDFAAMETAGYFEVQLLEALRGET